MNTFALLSSKTPVSILCINDIARRVFDIDKMVFLQIFKSCAPVLWKTSPKTQKY